VTFLFTDIEGSTRRWEADAQSMRAALLAHDEVLRTAIETHDGFLFSHSGDGVVAAFASPRSAVDAAITAQRKLELPVRMGLATGEAELRDGDYFGTVLNRAARVMAAGHGGQVLVADSAAALLTGVELVSLGPRRLRDVPNPITVYQLKAPGLQSDFPQLRTLDSAPGNLRLTPNSLIGREAEVAEVVALLRTRRMVTLTGVGGVGKTRLALEVAAHFADEFPDGVWVFELAAVTDPAAVPDAVAAVLGITQQPGKSMAESVAAALVGRVRLLVFDNCEHLLDAAADLTEAILAQSATVKILTTSREGLGLADERSWRVPSLEVGAAVELFAERAPNLTGDESAAVEEVCRRLDGIPLAIELAASRMESMTATEVRDRLDHRFKLLVGARRGLERHQTLRHAVSWSYDLLDDAEKSLLLRCSVFAGGFDLQSASAVHGSDDSDDYVVLDLLDALVRKSLLIADRSSGRTRYSMLETIRQFAEDQLVTSGAAEEVRHAHARHFAGREADLMAVWDSPRQREAYSWFAVELPNLRTAFRWAAGQGDLDAAASIATYATILGYWMENYEPIVWAEELVEPARAAGHRRLAALYMIASQCFVMGRVEEALRYSEAGKAVLSSGQHEVPFGIHGWLGSPYMAIGRPDLWAELCRDHLALGCDTHGVTRASLVFALAIAGSTDEAMAAAAGLIEATEATGNPQALSSALLAYGTAFEHTDPERALGVLRRGMVIAQESGTRFNQTMLAVMLSRLETSFGDPSAALTYVKLAVGNYHDSAATYSIHAPLAVLTVLFDRLGRSEPAATVAGFALNPMVAAGLPEINTATAHLRDALGGQTYESLNHKGAAMTTAEIVNYAYDQIDQSLAALKQSS
jgi:predicted ATPase